MTSNGKPDPVQDALSTAIGHHQAGRVAEAEAIYRQVMAAEPDHPDALHLLGMLAHQAGRHEDALDLIGRAIERAPASAAFHNNLGEVCRVLGRLEEAMSHYRQALALALDYTDATFSLGMVSMKLNDLDGAVECFRRVLAMRPDDADALEGLGVVLLGQEKPEQAAATLQKALSVDPDSPLTHRYLADALKATDKLADAAGHYRTYLAADPDSLDVCFDLGDVLMKLGRPAAAAEQYRKVVSLDPDRVAAHNVLGNALRDLDQLEEARECYRKGLSLKRAWPAPQAGTPAPAGRHGDDPAFSHVAAYKIAHDIEQFRYLLEKGVLPDDFADEVAAYQSVLEELLAVDAGVRVFEMTPDQRARIGRTYNRLVHVAEAPAGAESPINPDLDVKAIEDDYFANGTEATFIDDLLTPEALEGLRRFCLESTIWYDIYHNGGYLGAYLQEGFDCDLLLKIAEDLRRALPNIIGEHRLRHMWAYKYDSRLHGIPTHADAAAVNVNFWITPDDANLDAEGGGLVVYPREAPLEWDFKKYNNDQESIRAFIAGSEPIDVPYRQNRAVLFNSDYFHRTGDLNFKEGYENRRINVTRLYGWRDGSTPTG